jgi:hypothetical protein
MDARDDLLLKAAPAGLIGSRTEFQSAIRALIANAHEAGVRHMWWVSPDFADWPLDEPATVEALTHWSRLPGARLTWVGQDFEHVRRTMPRLTRWRQVFSHVITCRSPEEVTAADMPTLLVADHRLALRLLDRERVRGWLRPDAADVQQAHEQIDAISQRSSEAFPAVTLGL